MINELHSRIRDRDDHLSHQVEGKINNYFENCEVICTADGALHCELEHSGTEVKNIDFENSTWSITGQDNGELRASGSIPVDVKIFAEATLSAWDSEDKAHIEIEHQTILTDKNITVDISVKLYMDDGAVDWDDFFDLETNSETIYAEFEYVELG